MLNTQAIDSCLPVPLKFAKSTSELRRVTEFRRDSYRRIYPNVNVAKNDPFNEHSYIIYSDTTPNKVDSTASFIIDSEQGLPEDKYFPKVVDDYRKSGKKLMEIGRFVIEGKQCLLKHYYKAVLEVSIRENVDIVLMVIRQKDILFHQRLIGIDVLSEDIGENFGSEFPFACVAWDIAKTKPRFSEWVASV